MLNLNARKWFNQTTQVLFHKIVVKRVQMALDDSVLLKLLSILFYCLLGKKLKSLDIVLNCQITFLKSANDRFFAAVAILFIASISGPLYFNANFPLTRACTSSGWLSIIFDKSMYLRDTIALGLSIES